MSRNLTKLIRGTPSFGLEKGQTTVDRDKKIIHGASIISTGELIGHEMDADKTTLQQVLVLSAIPGRGTKVRFGHPAMSASAEGTFLGRARAFRLDGDDTVRADIHLDDTAFRDDGPNGNMGDYVLGLAESDPDAFGVSIVVDGEPEQLVDEDGNPLKDEDGEDRRPALRVKRLWAADVVDEPATGDGLFSRTVVLSATATEQLDKLCDDPDALKTITSYLERYRGLRAKEGRDTRVADELLTFLKRPTATCGGIAADILTPSKGEGKMDKQQEGQMPEADRTELQKAHEREIAEAREKAKAEERDRIDTIRKLGARVGASAETIEQFVNAGMSVPDAAKEFSRVENGQMNPVAGQAPHVQMGADEIDKFREGATNSIALKAKVMVDDKAASEVRRSHLSGLTLMGLARTCLERDGVHGVSLMSNEDVCARVFASAQRYQFAPGGTAQGTGDFVNILSNVLNKSLARGWETAPTTYQLWCGTGSLGDFKTADLVKVTEFSDIDEVPEGKAGTYGQFSDTKETAQLKTYMRLYSLTRQALVNDDLNWFSRVPMAIMRSVRRKMNKMAYGLIYNNNGAGTALAGPTMNEDSTALFTAGHANLVAIGAGGVVSEASITAGYNAMRGMRAPSPDGGRSATIALNIRPRYILCDRVNEVAAFVLNGSPMLSSTAGPVAGSQPVNIYGPGAARNLQVIADEEINILRSGMWYLAADPSEVGTVTCYTLNGKDAPTVKSEDARINEVQGISWGVSHDFVFAAEDYRGLYCNAGA